MNGNISCNVVRDRKGHGVRTNGYINTIFPLLVRSRVRANRERGDGRAEEA